MDKLSRCPRGTRRNKQSKLCEPVTKPTGVKITARKRCPNGMRRNRVTQNCESSTVKPTSSTVKPTSATEPKEGRYAYHYQLRENALQRLERAKPEEQKQYKREVDQSAKMVKKAIREVIWWIKDRITELKKQYRAENGKIGDLKKLAPTQLSETQIKQIVSETTQHDLATRIVEFEYVLTIIQEYKSDIDDHWLKTVVCYAAV